MTGQERRHTAIMFTDIVGYTALMGKNEDRAFEILGKNREIHTKLIEKFNGTLIKEMGDGMLVSFNLASDAVRCAIEIQKASKQQDIPLKIGIHEGEMVYAGSDVLGDGVNIASRLQEDTQEGCINISGSVYRDIKNKTGINAEFIDEKSFKNVDEPVKVYQVHCEEDIGEEQKPKEEETQKTKKKYLYYFLAGAVVVIATFLIWQFLPTKETNPPTLVASVNKSIAVLPFWNDSPDPDNEYFCNGMMDEILTHLQKIADISVKSRTSVEQYRNTTKIIKTIAEELNVPYLLEGSVRKYGGNFRITAKLIEASTGDHLWSETFDGVYTDTIFVVQANIAKRIASSLDAVITPVEAQRIDRRSTTNFPAYDYWLKGLDVQNKYRNTKDKKDRTTANDLFNKALEIDPEYAAVFVGKGRFFYIEKNYDSAIIYADRAIELDREYEGGYTLKGTCLEKMGEYDLAIEYLLKAVEISPNNSKVNLNLGTTYIRQKDDAIKGLPYLQKALELSDEDRAGIYNSIGKSYQHLSDYEKAEKYFLKALELQVGCGGIFSYTHFLHNQGRFNEALQFEDSICKILDCERACNFQMAVTYLYLKEFKSVEKIYQIRVEDGSLSTWGNITLAYIYKELGRSEEAMRILNDTRIKLENQLAKYRSRETLLRLTQIHAIQHEKNKAIKYLSEYAKLGFESGWHDEIEIYPTFSNLWDDPKYKAIVKRAQEKKAAIRAQLMEMEERGEIYL